MKELLRILNEGVTRARRDNVLANRMTEGEFQELLNLDPTKDNPQNPGKYIEWMCNKFVGGERDLAAYEILRDFENMSGRILTGRDADLTRYPTLEDLRVVVTARRGELTRTMMRGGLEDLADIPQEDIAFQNDSCVVVNPKTQETATLYGRGAHWCTAVVPGTGRGNLFYSQTHDGKISPENPHGVYVNFLYYILPKVNLGELMGLPPVQPALVDDPNKKYEKIAIRTFPSGYPSSQFGKRELRDFFNNVIAEPVFEEIKGYLDIP